MFLVVNILYDINKNQDQIVTFVTLNENKNVNKK